MGESFCPWERCYLAIDLKSFFASVECVSRGLDPLRTNLVVADRSRTEKTICLAVTPALKQLGIPGRPRLFEVAARVKEKNYERRRRAPGAKLCGSSCFLEELSADPALSIDYIVARPRMSLYMKYSTEIYKIYLRFVSEKDIHVYSIDEVFIDITDYLPTYRVGAHALAIRMIREVLRESGITATCGIGPNLYLAKIAMDIVAKHAAADQDGVRIAELDLRSYREKLWNHRPLTDFWRLGRGMQRQLEKQNLLTMGDIARCALREEGCQSAELLYRLFGVNAELLIDHAFGEESCTISEIQSYRPEKNSLGNGQVLHTPYPFEKARLIVREMTDLLALELLEKRLVTGLISLNIGFDIENLPRGVSGGSYCGSVERDHYGRAVPKPVHGSRRLPFRTSSARLITEAMMELYDSIADPRLLVRRIYLCAEEAVPEEETGGECESYGQLDLFTDYEKLEKEKREREERLGKERRAQEAILSLKRRFGKNAVLRGMNLEEGGTAIERNAEIGGHRSGEEEMKQRPELGTLVGKDSMQNAAEGRSISSFRGGKGIFPDFPLVRGEEREEDKENRRNTGNTGNSGNSGNTEGREKKAEGERRECLEKYGKILDADRPLLPAYPRMSLHKRASQFSPFAALTGYAAAVSESARRTEQRPELSEDQKEELDREFRKLSAELDRGESPRITLRFFLPDERKAGGSTQFYRGGLSKIDRQKRLLRFSDGTEISIPEITALRLDQA